MKHLPRAPHIRPLLHILRRCHGIRRNHIFSVQEELHPADLLSFFHRRGEILFHEHPALYIFIISKQKLPVFFFIVHRDHPVQGGVFPESASALYAVIDSQPGSFGSCQYVR